MCTSKITNNLIFYLNQIKDPRDPRGISHSLKNILLIVIMATMSGCLGERTKGDFVKRNKQELLKILKPPNHKLPSYQAIDRVMDKLDFDDLILIFIEWAKQFNLKTLNNNLVNQNNNSEQTKEQNLEWIHLDGKAITGTMTNYATKKQRFINLVSAFSSSRKQVLGFNLVNNSKESEIPKIKELIQLLGLEGVVFTADALHCQKDTAKLIVETKNDYVLQVKGNQKNFKIN
jgi:hypothetical protein